MHVGNSCIRFSYVKNVFESFWFILDVRNRKQKRKRKKNKANDFGPIFVSWPSIPNPMCIYRPTPHHICIARPSQPLIRLITQPSSLTPHPRDVVATVSLGMHNRDFETPPYKYVAALLFS
jgi:hypothetical protein